MGLVWKSSNAYPIRGQLVPTITLYDNRIEFIHTMSDFRLKTILLRSVRQVEKKYPWPFFTSKNPLAAILRFVIGGWQGGLRIHTVDNQEFFLDINEVDDLEDFHKALISLL